MAWLSLGANSVAVLGLCLACTATSSRGPSSPSSSHPTSVVGGAGASLPSASERVLDEVVNVRTLQLYVRCEGKGSPLVVLEAGLGLGASHWQRVQPEVARNTRACAYDRAGRGRSGQPPDPHPLPQMARELRELLRDTGQVGPYVVVGHSMGAGVVRWFELEHSDEVAGMVLVDPATADSITQAFATVPADALAEYDRNVRRMEGIDRETYLAGFTSLRNSGHRLGDRPLFVLTARKPESSFELRQQLRSEVNSLSSNVVRVTAENSGHDIPTDEPALVTRAILAVVRAVRTHQPVSKAWSAEGG